MAERLLYALAVSLTLTLALELLFALAWGVRGRALGLVALMNVLTNPAAVTLHFLALHVWNWPPVWTAVLVEVLVVLAEGLCCRGFIKRPWCFALLVNLFSYGCGLILQLFV